MHTLADILNKLKIASEKGISTVTLRPASNLTKDILSVMQKNGYIGQFEVFEDKRGGEIKVNLIGKINSCGVIKPRFPVNLKNVSKYERRYLIGAGMGLLILSTPLGVMSSEEARSKKVGGVLLGYVY